MFLLCQHEVGHGNGVQDRSEAIVAGDHRNAGQRLIVPCRWWNQGWDRMHQSGDDALHHAHAKLQALRVQRCHRCQTCCSWA